MITHHHTHEDQTPQPEVSVESEVSISVPAESGVISFKVNRQTLVVSALAMLLVISVFETIELTRLHQALGTWQTLPAAGAPTAVAAPAPVSGGTELPSQVGGC
ncbi:MAG: hypothetical protein Q8P77_00235 [Candidatus Veblenbacteria bacterium]|nr:hypothetical protein [Candidatus Veblenbacteria bacterium]